MAAVGPPCVSRITGYGGRRPGHRARPGAAPSHRWSGRTRCGTRGRAAPRRSRGSSAVCRPVCGSRPINRRGWPKSSQRHTISRAVGPEVGRHEPQVAEHRAGRVVERPDRVGRRGSRRAAAARPGRSGRAGPPGRRVTSRGRGRRRRAHRPAGPGARPTPRPRRRPARGRRRSWSRSGGGRRARARTRGPGCRSPGRPTAPGPARRARCPRSAGCARAPSSDGRTRTPRRAVGAHGERGEVGGRVVDGAELADAAVGADRRDPHGEPVVGRRDEPDPAAVPAERDLLRGVRREPGLRSNGLAARPTG